MSHGVLLRILNFLEDKIYYLLVALFISVGFFARPMVDDYSLHNLFAKKSVLESISYMYLNWSGRSITLFLCDLALMDFGLTPLFVVGTAFVYVVSIKQLSNLILVNSISIKTNSFIVLTICLLPFIPHTVFWSSSGITYIVPLFIASYWIKVFYYELETISAVKILLSIIAGSLLEQASILMLFIGALSFLSIGPIDEKGSRKNKMIFIGALIVGLLILICAPGNFVRAEVLKKISPESTDFFHRLIETFRRLGLASWKKVLLSFFGGGAIGLLSQSCNFETKWRLKNYSIVWIGASIALVLPFLIVDTPLNNRTLFFPVLCLSIYGLGYGFFFAKISRTKFNFILKFELFKRILLLLPSIAFILLLGRELYVAKMISNQIDNRFEKLSNSKNQEVKLEPINSGKSKLFFYKEISKDPKHWVNATMSEYFGTESIRLR